MKITQDIRSQLDTAKKHTNVSADNKSFHHIVRSQSDKLHREELHKVIENITIQGDRLVRYRSFRELAVFKRLVKNFLKEAVSNGLELNQSHSFSFSGHTRNLSIIKEIDGKLMELTETVLNKEKKGVDLLGMIGEIKGLLINIYS